MKKRHQDEWIKVIRSIPTWNKPRGKTQSPKPNYPTLSSSAKHLALALYQYSDNDTGICWPSEERLFEELGITQGIFDKGRRELIEMGLIEEKRRHNQNNFYTLINRTTSIEPVGSASIEPVGSASIEPEPVLQLNQITTQSNSLSNSLENSSENYKDLIDRVEGRSLIEGDLSDDEKARMWESMNQ